MSKYNVSLNDLKVIISRDDVPTLFEKMGAEVICEIGVRYGEYFKILFTPKLKEAVAVDLWTNTGVLSQNDVLFTQEELDKQYNNFLDLSKNDSRIKVIKDFSINASTQFSDGHFDFVYIDADHTEPAVQKDINAWWPKVRSGGVLAGHDYSHAAPVVKGTVLKFGVIEAVNKFVQQNKVQLHVDKNQSWFIPKP
jgi:hypothetical protein